MKIHRVLPVGLIAAFLATPGIMCAASSTTTAAASSNTTTKTPSATDAKAGAPGSNGSHTQSSATSTYYIHTGDVVHVEVISDANATAEHIVDFDGTFQLNYLDKPISIAGMTVEQAKAAIAKEYADKEIFVDPKVNIRIAQYSEQHVNVIGQVGRPSEVIIPPNQQIKLVDAVAQAGGHTRLAAHKVTITRREADGKTTTITANLYDAMSGDSKENVLLQDGDTVYVDESVIGW